MDFRIRGLMVLDVKRDALEVRAVFERGGPSRGRIQKMQ